MVMTHAEVQGELLLRLTEYEALVNRRSPLRPFVTIEEANAFVAREETLRTERADALLASLAFLKSADLDYIEAAMAHIARRAPRHGRAENWSPGISSAP